MKLLSGTDTWGRPLEYYLICSDSFNPASAAEGYLGGILG